MPRPAPLVAAAAAILIAAAPAQGAATVTAALWSMDEPAGTSVLVDASGNGRDGTIGAEVVHPVTVGDGTGHRFPYLAPNTPPAHPGHLDRVADMDALDPGSRDYAITVRARWTRNFGNMLQKGQSGARGGYWKWEAPNGIVRCLFRDSSGRTKTATSKAALNDGAWHVIRCEKNGSGVFMWVDGASQLNVRGPLGSIANSWQLTIGGKGSCDQITVTCDYWVGDMDYVRIETS